MSDIPSANPEQHQYWNETAGPKWAQLSDVIDTQIAPLGGEAMERIGIGAGQRVLDVGCGCGQTTLELARRVGAEGAVLGADISRPMLEGARARADATGIANARFEQADAQVHPFEAGAFDLVFSRFGVMFFSDPVAAFANLLRALQPGARLGFVCWQALAQNAWMLRPMAALAPLLSLQPPSDPHAPGPFAFADADRVTRILRDAGFGSVAVEGMERELLVGGGASLDDTVGFLLQMGPAGAALREADDDLRAKAADAVREAIAPFHGDAGVRMPAAAWLFTAVRPA
jgi:SAM-dependent methyltransferase